MTITLIDEARYDAEMDATVLPALQACMTEGWMEPATVDWEGKALPKLELPLRRAHIRRVARGRRFGRISWHDRHFARIHRIRTQIQRNGVVLSVGRLFGVRVRASRAWPFRARYEQSKFGMD